MHICLRTYVYVCFVVVHTQFRSLDARAKGRAPAEMKPGYVYRYTRVHIYIYIYMHQVPGPAAPPRDGVRFLGCSPPLPRAEMHVHMLTQALAHAFVYICSHMNAHVDIRIHMYAYACTRCCGICMSMNPYVCICMHMQTYSQFLKGHVCTAMQMYAHAYMLLYEYSPMNHMYASACIHMFIILQGKHNLTKGCPISL